MHFYIISQVFLIERILDKYLGWLFVMFSESKQDELAIFVVQIYFPGSVLQKSMCEDFRKGYWKTSAMNTSHVFGEQMFFRERIFYRASVAYCFCVFEWLIYEEVFTWRSLLTYNKQKSTLEVTQLMFTCSHPTIGTLEKDVKRVQS